MEEKDDILPQMSIYKLIRQLWDKKFFLILVSFIFGTVGFILSLSIPKQYRTEVLLAPESTESELASAASSISSFLGMNMPNAGGDAIYPELYPSIIATIPFSVDMMNITVCTIDSSYCGSLYHYLAYKQKSAWWNKIRYKLKGLLVASDSKGMLPDTLNPYSLSKKQVKLIEGLNKRICCEVDVKTSVITLSAEMQDKLVAYTVADSLCKKLQDYITAYRTNKVRNDLATLKRMYEEAKSTYIEAQCEYASFVDRNSNLVKERMKAEAVRLENEVNMTYTIYSELSTQVAMTRAKLQEKTPAFTVLEPARLAEWHYTPKKSVIAIIWAIMGCFIVSVYLLVMANKETLFSVFKSEE